MNMSFKAGETKSLDEGKGIVIGCENDTLVSLVFDKSASVEQVRELERMIDKMRLIAVEVDVPDLAY